MIVAMERKLISELIDEYKTCTCLWRIKDPDYKNKEMKNEAYESLLRLIKKSLEFLNDQHHSDDRVRLGRSYPDNSDEDNESNETHTLVYDDVDEPAGSEDKDSCSTEPEYLQQPHCPATSSLQTILSGGYGGDGVRKPKRRRRVLQDASSSSAAAAAATQHGGPPARAPPPAQDRYSGGAVDYYEPQILGGVGGDPAEPPVADYYDGFGRYVANELRQMDRQSVIIAKRLVNEVLFLGQMGMLNVNTRIETPPAAGRRKSASGAAACGRSEARHRRHRHRMQYDEDDEDQDDQDEDGGGGGGRESSSSPMPPVEFMETS